MVVERRGRTKQMPETTVGIASRFFSFLVFTALQPLGPSLLFILLLRLAGRQVSVGLRGDASLAACKGAVVRALGPPALAAPIGSPGAAARLCGRVVRIVVAGGGGGGGGGLRLPAVLTAASRNPPDADRWQMRHLGLALKLTAPLFEAVEIRPELPNKARARGGPCLAKLLLLLLLSLAVIIPGHARRMGEGGELKEALGCGGKDSRRRCRGQHAEARRQPWWMRSLGHGCLLVCLLRT